MGSSKLNATYSPETGAGFPTHTSIATPPTNLFSTPAWVVGAVQTVAKNIFSNNLNGAQDFPIVFGLTAFPPAISLRSGSQAIIQATAYATGTYPLQFTLSLPVVQLLSGNTVLQTASGFAVFTLQPGQNYSNLSLRATFRISSTAAIGQVTIPVAVTAVLYGLTASVV